MRLLQTLTFVEDSVAYVEEQSSKMEEDYYKPPVNTKGREIGFLMDLRNEYQYCYFEVEVEEGTYDDVKEMTM